MRATAWVRWLGAVGNTHPISSTGLGTGQSFLTATGKPPIDPCRFVLNGVDSRH